MFSWMIITVGFEFNNKLYMQHHSNFTHDVCEHATLELTSNFNKKHPNKKIKAVKCNDPITWFKKYRLNKWDQVKDKE